MTDIAVVKWDSNEDAKKEEKWSIKRLYEFEIHVIGSEAIKRISPYWEKQVGGRGILQLLLLKALSHFDDQADYTKIKKAPVMLNDNLSSV